jgi:hypothetical protein
MPEPPAESGRVREVAHTLVVEILPDTSLASHAHARQSTAWREGTSFCSGESSAGAARGIPTARHAPRIGGASAFAALWSTSPREAGRSPWLLI